MDKYDGIGEALEQARHLIGRARRGFLEKTNRRPLIGKTQLADVGKHVGPCSLRTFAIAIRDPGGIDAAKPQSLSDCGGIAEDTHFEIVLVRIDAKLIQDDHRLEPKTAADALHTEGLAAKILQD